MQATKPTADDTHVLILGASRETLPERDFAALRPRHRAMVAGLQSSLLRQVHVFCRSCQSSCCRRAGFVVALKTFCVCYRCLLTSQSVTCTRLLQSGSRDQPRLRALWVNMSIRHREGPSRFSVTKYLRILQDRSVDQQTW